MACAPPPATNGLSRLFREESEAAELFQRYRPVLEFLSLELWAPRKIR
jgi:hypothetical protein